MKTFLKYAVVLLGLTSLVSCGGDDNICESGEGSPRMKVRFRNSSGQLKRVDSLYLRVDYGGSISDFGKTASVDSLLFRFVWMILLILISILRREKMKLSLK